MATRIGTVTGIALVPGVSRNGRLYTAEAIGKAVQRARARIAEGNAPLTMLTHHSADDDSTQIVGRLTSISQAEDGTARYAADLADTVHGRSIAALVDNTDGPPFLSGVSIRGAWIGKVRRQPGPDGQPVETADDLELDGLDFTRKPGVIGASVDTYTPAEANAPAETAYESRVLITESVQEALVNTTLTEAAAEDGDTGGPFADPGYQSDKKKRYDLGTKAKAKAAWSYISQADNARLYTSAQLKRIKQRIVKALKGYGVTVAAQEGWLIEPAAAVTESLAECWGMDAGDAGNLYVSLTNGPTTVSVTSYSLDPHDLDAVGRAAMDGACRALASLDPDMDADVDVPGEPADTIDSDPATSAGAPCPCGCGCAIPANPGACPCSCESCAHCTAPEESDDNAMETAPASPTEAMATAGNAIPASAADGITQTPAAESAAENPTQEKEPAMAESTTPAAESAAAPAAGGVTLTDEQFKMLLAAITPQTVPDAATESAPAEAVAEAAPVTTEVTETDDQRIARLVAEGIAAALPKAVQEHVETAGGPSRKGLVVSEAASTGGASSGLPEGAPSKPLHEYTDEEWRQHIAPNVVGAVLGARGQLPE